MEWLVARMAERGFRASVDDAGNAVGEIGEGPTHVVLLGHIDTVPGEIPVRVENDELVGRGAVDAKSPLAAFVAAATTPIAGLRVTVVGAVEEESPTSAGARHRATLPAPDWCVIGEPSGWDAVTVAYKGRLAVRVALSRSARHGAAPGMTCTEEALALWSTVRAAADRRTGETDGFARLDCRLEGIS
ncbi:MAG: M20/M25/M40 family metallo-hydrolase, partial [Chloroflexota bacterium]|nr:M20/M25/M40 family metallo-hydrolase [Chloroflexota bacterium]